MHGSLDAIRNLNDILENAVCGATGTHPTPECGYLLYTAKELRDLVSGYVSLRTSGHVYASKVLVRPMIEGTLNAIAALRDKSFLLNKAYDEHKEEKKLTSDAAAHAHLDAEFAAFKAEWVRIKGPAEPKKQLTLLEISQKAGLESMYETAYRHLLQVFTRCSSSESRPV